MRYVIGGFIAVADKVEHVARLNERGNRLLLLPEPTPEELRQARPRLEWGLQPNYCNPVCSMEWGLQPNYCNPVCSLP